jgi:electron transfer flavoprotein alpha subunit
MLPPGLELSAAIEGHRVQRPRCFGSIIPSVIAHAQRAMVRFAGQRRRLSVGCRTRARPRLQVMIAVVVVRDGQLPAGGDETVAECDGRALLLGSGTATAAQALVGIATHVIAVETGPFQPGANAARLAPLLVNEPAVVLPGSPDGRDLAPRLAALLHRSLFAGAIKVSTTKIELTRNGSTEIHEVNPGPTFVATLQPGVRGAAPAPNAAAPTIEHLDAAAGSAARDAEVHAVLPPDPATIDLAEATRIVGGGAGLDGPARMTQLGRVGAALGASTGATRVLTDRGWAAHERQIGTTGVVVNPRLYLAFGISGAVQHTSGLGNPDHVISVNTDGHCPMMQLADLAIIGDANAVLDELERVLDGPT